MTPPASQISVGEVLHGRAAIPQQQQHEAATPS